MTHKNFIQIRNVIFIKIFKKVSLEKEFGYSL